MSLDAELVRELQRSEGSVSQQINEAVWEMLARRHRQRMLARCSMSYLRNEGPLPADLIDKYTSLLV